MSRWAWLLVLGVTLGVWAPVLGYNWVATWDDAPFFLLNHHIRHWDWSWMATTQHYGHWMPLMWLSATSTYAAFGYQAWAWHGVNVALHAISAVLLFFIARHLVGSTLGAVFAALVFAVHPLRMESVAWITERKDVLMGVFFLAAALLWLQGRRGWAFAAFVAACASKSPAVMLPVWLLALDWYRVDPIKAEFDRPSRFWLMLSRPLIPFFAVSVVVAPIGFFSLATFTSSLPWTTVPLGPRLLHVAYSEVFYAWQSLWPQRLSALIEYTWVPSWDQPQYLISVAICLVGAAVLWWTRRRTPALIAAALAYTVAVLPQSGLFQNGAQLVANRYSYLACVPLAILAGGLATQLRQRWPRSSMVAAVGVVLALIVRTETSLPMWRDGDAMWQYAALHEPSCTQCLDMAAAADLRHGRFEAAIEKQRRAVAVSDTTMTPRWERHWNLAAILELQGRRDEAIRELHIYLAVVPASRRDTEIERDHMERARQALARLQPETY